MSGWIDRQPLFVLMKLWLILTAQFLTCSVRGMKSMNARAEYDLELVATENGLTAGFWFYFGFFYASPAMLAERESRMT
jgi:hypothetical protein